MLCLQLSAMDVSARTTMKGAAKCDKHCDLQNSVNQQGFERILRFRDTPESMPASESTLVSCCRRAFLSVTGRRHVSAGRVCAPRRSRVGMPLMHSVHLPAERCATDRSRSSLPVTVARPSAVLQTWLTGRLIERHLARGQFLDMKSGRQTR